jgi:hypothetical protein
MDGVAYLVNSTPSCYYMLPLHFALVRRYAPFMKHLFLATEVPEHPVCAAVAAEYGVELIPLKLRDAGFLESRLAALWTLLDRFKYVLPAQEDFLLDRPASQEAMEEALTAIKNTNEHIVSARLMPCPGPKGETFESYPRWAFLSDKDEYGFTFQATLWSTKACYSWYHTLCRELEEAHPYATTSPDQRRHIEIRANFAENPDGQRLFWRLFSQNRYNGIHIAWRRAGPWPNAVYLSPWPYRPTAIVQGRLEPWAVELGKREGIVLCQN